MRRRTSTYRRRRTNLFRSRRNTTRRSTYKRRRGNVYRRRRPVGNSTVYRFARLFSLDLVGPPNNTTDVGGQISYALQQVPGYANFTDMFEEYKITKVKFTMRPRAGFNNTNSQDFGCFYIWNDYDDNTVPTAETQFLRKMDGKAINMSASNSPVHTWSCRPKYLKPIFIVPGSVASFGQSPASGGWISTRTPGLAHFGTKWYWTDQYYGGTTPAAADLPRMHVLVKVYMKFRRPY